MAVGGLSKRLFDLFGACFGLILLSPIFVGLCLAVRIKHGRPIFFKQLRPGHKGRGFRIMKFRTMTNQRDSTGALLPNDKRLTKLGKFLRRSSLDELPELFNVIKGEMSLVGPRPLRFDFLDYYSTEEMKRHDAKPGITGHAQVNGRNCLNWDEKMSFDLWYVRNQSLWLDIKIILKTIQQVFKSSEVQVERGLAKPPSMPMEVFMPAPDTEPSNYIPPSTEGSQKHAN